MVEAASHYEYVPENRAVQPSVDANSFYTGGTRGRGYYTTGCKTLRMLLVGEAANHS